MKGCTYGLAALMGLLATCNSFAAIQNGGFETGDLTGWTANYPSLVSVTSSHKLAGQSETLYRYPTEGQYFALLATGGGTGVYTLLSQAFSANAGDNLGFDVFFDAGDYLPYNDTCYVNLLRAGDKSFVEQLFYSDVYKVGDYGSTPWTAVSYTFTTADTYQLEVGVANIRDNALNSYVGVDNVVIPEPISLIIWTLMLGGAAAGWRLRNTR